MEVFLLSNLDRRRVVAPAGDQLVDRLERFAVKR